MMLSSFLRNTSKHEDKKETQVVPIPLFIPIIFYMSLLLLCLLCCWATPARASIFGWHFSSSNNNTKELSDPNSDYLVRTQLPYADDITSDQDINKVTLTPEQKHQALVWGLTEDQEKRYVLLMQNRSGLYYQKSQLTPVEILGINARTNNERQVYAVLDAKQEFERTGKLLAFNAAYHEAATQLKNQLDLPMIRPFDATKFSPYSYRPTALKPHDQLMFFIHMNDAVKPVVSYLMAAIIKEPTISLNIYFVGKEVSKREIEAWARGQNIPSTMVNKRQITLNFDQGKYDSLTIKMKKAGKMEKTPLLILIRDGQSHPVDTGRF